MHAHTMSLSTIPLGEHVAASFWENTSWCVCVCVCVQLHEAFRRLWVTSKWGCHFSAWFLQHLYTLHPQSWMQLNHFGAMCEIRVSLTYLNDVSRAGVTSKMIFVHSLVAFNLTHSRLYWQHHNAHNFSHTLLETSGLKSVHYCVDGVIWIN